MVLIFFLSLLLPFADMNFLTPSFYDMTLALGMTERVMQHSLSLHFLGFCIGALLFGPVSDYKGRRSVLLGGYSIMVIGAWGCTMSWNVYALMLFRFLQGFGTSAPMVLVFTLVSELYAPKKATKMIGHFHAYLAISLFIAPIVGEYIQGLGGWRINHGTFALGATIISLGQHYILPKIPTSVPTLGLGYYLQAYGKVLRQKTFVIYLMLLGLFSTIFMIYLSTGVLFYHSYYGLKGHTFLYHYCTVLGLFSGTSLMMGYIVQYWAAKRVIQGAFWCCALSMVGGFLHTFFPMTGCFFTFYFSIFGVGYALFYPLVLSQALALCFHGKGVASSCIMAVRALMMTGGLGLSSLIQTDRSPQHFFYPMLLCVSLAVFFYMLCRGVFEIQGKKDHPDQVS